MRVRGLTRRWGSRVGIAIVDLKRVEAGMMGGRRGRVLGRRRLSISSTKD